MRALLLALTCILPVLSGPADARLPPAPSTDQAHGLIEDVRIKAAGRTRTNTRMRLEREIEAATGSTERLQNNGGIGLILAGYPWEALWFLTNSALSNLEQADVLNNVGLALILVEEHADAEQLLLYVTVQWPNFHPAWTNLARLYTDLKDYTKAREALDNANTAAPGTTGAEEVALRIGVEQGNMHIAARHAVNLGRLDPGNPLLETLLPHIPDSAITNTVSSDIDTLPLPEIYIELDTPIGDYVDFVMDEVNRHYWNMAMTHFAGDVSRAIDFQYAPLPHEVFSQLPPEMQQAARQAGLGPNISAPNPADSRGHYPRLAMHMLRYEEYYRSELKSIYAPVKDMLSDQVKRANALMQQHGMDEYGRRIIINYLSEAHPRFLEELAAARGESNRLLRRHWRTMAGLITMVPEAHRDDEVRHLTLQAALSGQRYVGTLQSWINAGLMVIYVDEAMGADAPARLHTAAAGRAQEALLDREETNAELEPELDTYDDVDLSGLWIGLNLGIYAVKIGDDGIGITGGEGLVGDVSYNWDTEEFELGVGIGSAAPVVLSGASGKMLGVVRVGGQHGFALGIREQIQISVGTPVAGADVNVLNEHQWLYSSGQPNMTLPSRMFN